MLCQNCSGYFPDELFAYDFEFLTILLWQHRVLVSDFKVCLLAYVYPFCTCDANSQPLSICFLRLKVAIQEVYGHYQCSHFILIPCLAFPLSLTLCLQVIEKRLGLCMKLVATLIEAIGVKSS